VPGRLAVTIPVQEIVRYRSHEFSLQAADILMHSDTLASNQIKHVIYAGHAWHQRERGRSTANLARLATVPLVP
jgi:hypothetical protein